MGVLFAKPKPLTRDEQRVNAARQHIDGAVADALIALGKTIQGRVLLAPQAPYPLGGSDEADAYHRQRERPFSYSDCHYPSAIIVAETANDVVKTVQLINGLNSTDRARCRLCVAGGGHSSYCMVEKSICLDLAKLARVDVDLTNLTVSVQGGAKIVDVHTALRGTGYGFCTGTNGDTGVSGLTLAGGLGWLSGQAGFACDTVIRAEVVLPSGQIVVASDDNQYRDLMRGLRGGGGNFGIVTQWTFRLYDVSQAFGGMIAHFCPTQASLKTVLRNYHEKMTSTTSTGKPIMPDEAAAMFAIPLGTPILATILTAIGSKEVFQHAKVYTDVPFLKHMSNLGAWFQLTNAMGRKDYIQEIAPLLEAQQQRGYWTVTGVMMYAMDDAVFDTLVHFARVDVPGKNTKPTIICASMSGECRRNDGSKSSIRHRQALAWIIIEAAYEPHATKAQIDNVIAWANRLKARLLDLGGEDGPHDFRDTEGRRIKYFTEEQRVFLERTKQKYDPTNMLSLNKNIIVPNDELL